MEYNIFKTEVICKKSEPKVVGEANSLEEAEMLKRKLETQDTNYWNIYEIKAK